MQSSDHLRLLKADERSYLKIWIRISSWSILPLLCCNRKLLSSIIVSPSTWRRTGPTCVSTCNDWGLIINEVEFRLKHITLYCSLCICTYIPALRLLLQTFQVIKDGHLDCSNAHICTFSWAQPKMEKFTFIVPIYHCSTGFCSHTIASLFWGWLQIMSILYSEKNPICINTSFSCLQIF